MSLRNDILQATREWLKAFGDPAGLLTDDQVSKGDDPGPRPTLDYVGVKVGTVIPVGTTEKLTSDTAGGQTVFKALVSAKVQCTAYGETAAEWMDHAVLVLPSDAALEQLGDAGIAISGQVVTDLSALIDTGIEYRTLLEFDVLFRYESAAQTTIAATTIKSTLTFDPEGDTLVEEIELTP